MSFGRKSGSRDVKQNKSTEKKQKSVERLPKIDKNNQPSKNRSIDYNNTRPTSQRMGSANQS